MSTLLTKRVHIIGKKNHGKTTLVCALIEGLTRRGFRVGSVKHSSHDHALDVPGKDSYRHREHGGEPAVVMTPHHIGVFLRRPDDPYAHLAHLYEDCDLVLVEGNVETDAPKIEVWREALGTPPLATEREEILAIVSDDLDEAPCPIWPRADLERLLDEIIRIAGVSSPA